MHRRFARGGASCGPPAPSLHPRPQTHQRLARPSGAIRKASWHPSRRSSAGSRRMHDSRFGATERNGTSAGSGEGSAPLRPGGPRWERPAVRAEASLAVSESAETPCSLIEHSLRTVFSGDDATEHAPGCPRCFSRRKRSVAAADSPSDPPGECPRGKPVPFSQRASVSSRSPCARRCRTRCRGRKEEMGTMHCGHSRRFLEDAVSIGE